MAKTNGSGAAKKVKTLKHSKAKRKNIPTAELQSAAQRAEELEPFPPVTYARRRPLAQGETRPRNRDLDPQLVWKETRIRLTPEQIEQVQKTGYLDIDDTQLVWRGKDEQDWSDLVVQAPPIYVQDKIHPKAIIDDLMRRTKEAREEEPGAPDLFSDFNGIDPEAKTEFYAHDQNWSNRFILGDSLQVMASLAEREGLRGEVQCIYFDPPYGIKFNSNWQVSTRSRDVKDGKIDQITREPEQVQAFRDTWSDGIHSYLAYLRDRLTAMRDLLAESGSIFVQIGDENVHRVKTLMEEVFGAENFIVQIDFVTTTSQTAKFVSGITDHCLWFTKSKPHAKFRELKLTKNQSKQEESSFALYEENFVVSRRPTSDQSKLLVFGDLTSRSGGDSSTRVVNAFGREFIPKTGGWKSSIAGIERAYRANRIGLRGANIFYKRYFDDWPYSPMPSLWTDTQSGGLGVESRTYVVQTNTTVVQRCILMVTDPGDLVLDPTCGSGTTATVAEQWGRRWITLDTSRVALALARARVMGARYPYYLLADSDEGRTKEAELTSKPPSDTPTHGDVRQGFVCERAPHITLKSIANNAEIDVIWDEYQAKLEPLRIELNVALGTSWEEWEIPRVAEDEWSKNIKGIHAAWWGQRIARQQEIDKSIAQKADVELLYDRPYEDKSKVRVAGPFTVESLSPHRVIASDDDSLAEELEAADGQRQRKVAPLNDFAEMILDHLRSSGVHQAAKDDRITFAAITGWPGNFVCAEGRFHEGDTEKRAAIFIGPEFGTVSRADLTAAAREALDARFDVLIACGFNFEAHTSELNKLGPLPILKAKMNPELHMSDELKNTGAGNMFVVFGEPDIEWKFQDDGKIVVKVLGIDVFDPKTGDVRASGKDDIAAWFIDTDYNEESFFVRHAYFLGAHDPYKALKTTLKAEIDEDAWATLYRDVSRPFARPKNGRFAVKVINHFGDEVMKVFAV